MTTNPTHPGTCGIHLFADPERARARRCDVCAWAIRSALEDSKKRFMERPDRVWDDERRERQYAAMGKQRAYMQGTIHVARGERTHRTQAAKLAAEATAGLRDSSGRFTRETEERELAETGS